MKELNLKLLLTILLTTLLTSGCMPDSLTKWNADPPQLEVDPVVPVPVSPSSIIYPDEEMTIPSAVAFTTTPVINTSDAVTFQLIGCTNSTFSDCSLVPTLPTGLTFNTTTGTISGTPTNPPFARRYFRVSVYNSSTALGQEPFQNISLACYEAIDPDKVVPQLVDQTKLIMTISDASVYEDTGATTNARRHIVSVNEEGRGIISFIDYSGESPVLYVTMNGSGIFFPGDQIDVGQGAFSTAKATIKDIVVALPSGTQTGTNTPFLTINIPEGDAVWNAAPQLPTSHITSDLPVQDVGNPQLWGVSIKGHADCTGTATEITDCQERIDDSLTESSYTLILSNPLIVNPEDYITFTFKLSFSEAPKYFGYGQHALLRVISGSSFSSGDTISTKTLDGGDFRGIVLAVDTSPTGYDNVFVKIDHGIPESGAQLGMFYPLQGVGVTRLLNSDEEDQYDVTYYTPFQGALTLDDGGGQDATDFFASDGNGPIFLAVPGAASGAAVAAGAIHPEWYGQAYPVAEYNNNLFIMPTEMSGAMDDALVPPTSIGELDTNYYTKQFRADANNKIIMSDGDTARIRGFSGNNYDITSIKAANVLMVDANAAHTCSGVNAYTPGREITFNADQSGIVMSCNSTNDNAFHIASDAYDLTGGMSSDTDIDFASPFAGGAAPITSMQLDKVFYVNQNEKASLLLFKHSGTNMRYQITPALPEGLALDADGNISTQESGKVTGTAGRVDYKLTAFNALGQISYYFAIEVVPAMIVESSLQDTDSYIMHQTGQGHQRRKCIVTKAQLDNYAATSSNNARIQCYLDAGENELHFKGVEFNLKVSKSLCNNIVYKPYFYYRDQYAEVNLSYTNVVISDGSGFCGAQNLNKMPSAWVADNNLDTAAICDSLILPGVINQCGKAQVSVSGVARVINDDATGCNESPISFDQLCGNYNYKNCLGGAGSSMLKDINRFDADSSPFYTDIDYSVRYDSVPGVAVKVKHFAAEDFGRNSRYYSNFTTSNSCTDGLYNYHADNWSRYAFGKQSILSLANNTDSPGDNYPGIADGLRYNPSLMITHLDTNNDVTIEGPIIDTEGQDNYWLQIADPFKMAQPFYTFECRNAEDELIGDIRIIVREWDQDFKAVDDIDQVSPPAYFNVDALDPTYGQPLDNYQSWDAAPSNNAFLFDRGYKDATGGSSVLCSAGIPVPNNNPVGAATTRFNTKIPFFDVAVGDGGPTVFNYDTPVNDTGAMFYSFPVFDEPSADDGKTDLTTSAN